MDGKEIKAFRHKMGWTQSDLAEKLMTRQVTVSAWENGVKPSRVYQELFKALKLKTSKQEAT